MYVGVQLKQKSIFLPSGSRNFPEMNYIGPDFRCLNGSVVKPPIIGSQMKPQLYTDDFDIFQSNAYFGVEESPFTKTCTSVDGPNKPSLRAVAQI